MQRRSAESGGFSERTGAERPTERSSAEGNLVISAARAPCLWPFGGGGGMLSELLVKPWRGAERDASKKHNENSRRPPVHAARNAGLSPMPSFSVTRLL